MIQKNFRLILSLLLLVCFEVAPLAPVARAANAGAVVFTVPVATSFSTYVPANRQSAIVLQGSDAEGTPLVYAIAAGPSHGALSGLNTATGAVVYTPVDGYTGADSFTYTVTSGGETSPAGTVTLTVTNQKTRIIDTLTNASGAARSGKVTFILTQPVASPAGLIPAGASVSATVNGAGTFDVQVFPSKSLSPQAYYQVYFSDSNTLNRELLGIYEIPFSTSTVSLAPYKVLDTNLAARYTFASAAAVESLTNAVATATLSQLLAGGSLASLNVAGQVTAGSINTGAVTATNITISGAMTAASFIGNGAGLTGIGTGTGGVINTGSTTIGADSDSDGVGIIDLQTRATSRLTIENDGALKGPAIRDATGSINVKQYGAKCDGTTNDSAAFLAAINAAITSGNSKTIRIPASSAPCQITTTVTKAFGATYDIIFQGDGSGSVVRLATGASADAFAFTGGASIVFRDLAFVGTEGVQDVRSGFKFDQSTKVLFEDCAFYGLASANDLILANLSYLYVHRSHFYGCAADGSFNYGIINNTNWSGIKVTDTQFFDYGQLNGVNYTKGGIGFPQSWIAARNPKTTMREVIVGSSPGLLSTANSQGTFTVEGCYFDEGAGYSILASSDIGGGQPLIERVRLKNNNHNVTQAGGAAVYLYGTNDVEIEACWFGYVYLGDVAGVVLNGAGNVRLRNCIFGQRVYGAAVISPTAGATSRLTIEDCVYTQMFFQVATMVDVLQGGKRRVKNYDAGTYSYATLTPSFDLEVLNSLSLGGEATWIKGTGAPSGGCSTGSFYSRTDGGAGTSWYVCESGAWVAK